MIALLALVSARAEAAASAPRASVETQRIPRGLLFVGSEGGFDDNVRLLAPIELQRLETTTPVADGFLGVNATLALDPPRAGWSASANLGVRRFFDADNGVLGSGALRGGYRLRRGALLFEPALDFSAFAWSVFGGDAHLAPSLAPELSVRRGRLAVVLAPSLLARIFETGTDLEGWLSAQGTLRLGRADLTLGYFGGKVGSATPALSRVLHRASLGVALGLTPTLSAGARLSYTLKQLPAYVDPEYPGKQGRSDKIVAGHLQARWQFARAFAASLAIDYLVSESSSDAADFDRFSATAGLEWRWETPGSRQVREGGRRTLTFRLEAEGAREVALAGSFTNWEPVALHRGAEGWSVTMPVEPGDHHYGFLVDGVWTLPSGVPLADDGLGGQDVRLGVGGE